MTVTFRCKVSGNLVDFESEYDIKGMRKHDGYEEVKEVVKDEVKKGPGRPKKDSGDE